MAKKRKSSGSGKGPGKVTDKITRVATKSPNVLGRPGYTETGQTRRVGTIRPFHARGVTTLIKKDVAKGVTQPEFKTASADVGQITPQARPGIQHQTPQVPVKTGTNQRVTKAPSPTQGAGVRSPFNAKSRVGRGRGSNTRFNKN